MATPIFFSADSKHWATSVCKKELKECVILADGKESTVFESIGSVSFEGNQLLYTATKNGKEFVFVDGKEETRGLPYISPDGKARVYVQPAGEEGYRVQVNEKAVGPFLGVTGVTFSPDSTHFAFARFDREKSKQSVMLFRTDGTLVREDKGYDYLDVLGFPFSRTEPSRLIFSPDSKHVAYVATIRGKETGLSYPFSREKDLHLAILDGKEVRQSTDFIPSLSLVFTPDSSELLSHADHLLMRGNKLLGSYTFLGWDRHDDAAITFGKNESGQWSLILFDRSWNMKRAIPLPNVDFPIWANEAAWKYSFVGGTILRFGARQGEDLVKVEVRLGEWAKGSEGYND